MKATVYTKYGPPDVLQLQDIPFTKKAARLISLSAGFSRRMFPVITDRAQCQVVH
jgi:hypothetical protein